MMAAWYDLGMRGAIHHLDLTVTDPQASFALYDAVLRFMGYRLSRTDEDGFDWDCGEGGPFCSVGLIRSRGPAKDRRHDRYSAGLHHVAWRAESRADVDAMYELVKGLGATVLDPPADYPQYGDGYYAVFFADPDGLKLEFVFKP